jgi:hypothetical protein
MIRRATGGLVMIRRATGGLVMIRRVTGGLVMIRRVTGGLAMIRRAGYDRSGRHLEKNHGTTRDYFTQAKRSRRRGGSAVGRF